MLKRWFSIKEIEVYLLREILISKDTLQGQKTVASLLNQGSFSYKSHVKTQSGGVEASVSNFRHTWFLNDGSLWLDAKWFR